MDHHHHLLPPTTTIQWNTILRSSPPHRALSLYPHMLRSGVHPNKFTFTFLIKACLQIPNPLKHIHCHLIKLNLSSDPFLLSALIHSYSSHPRHLPTVRSFARISPRHDPVIQTSLVTALFNLGDHIAARRTFDAMPVRTPASYAALVSAYARAGLHADALRAFHEIPGPPTEAAAVSALSSAARLGDLDAGARVHLSAVGEGRLRLSAGLGTALLTMYARCGRVDRAVEVFSSMRARDATAWTAMVSALAAHGMTERALALFEEMVGCGVQPDRVAYVAVLSACARAGLVEAGRRCFERMVSSHGIEPGREHYGCMVDLLGRAGRVKEAWELVRSMPMEPDSIVLKALLSACSGGEDVGAAEWAVGRLMELNPDDTSPYVLLANLYAGVHRWVDVARVRRTMRARGAVKVAGASGVAVNGKVHRFMVGDSEWNS
ncbi:Pentatricopeptide repeat-containing protein [Acorus calamus]|uniref:Pentatricopeptide repeat-containing protein n=1 Tax=Acorus calamus TaxID=4465 RepID=A0AAV9F957_ACOCL|nr:Pentatricopeptide repeat-containing protein [Acorus calamus]